MVKLTMPDMGAKIDKINSVTEKKNGRKVLTMEEAWKKISGMKNSDSDKEKLAVVFRYFQEGKIGREAGSEGKSFSKAEALRLYILIQAELRAEKLEKLASETPDNYIAVLTEDTLLEMLDVLTVEPYIPVDTETTGLNCYGKDKIVAVQFSAMSANKHYYIPVRMDDYNCKSTKVWGVIEEILSFPNKDYILANAGFDMHQFRNEGIEIVGKVHDVQTIMAILNENELSYRLKDLVTKYLKMPSDTFDALFGKNCKFNTVPIKYARYYACKDTHVTGLLYQFEMEHLKAQKGLYDYYMNVEQPLIKVSWEMEREGFYIDLEEADRQKDELKAKLPQLEEELKKHLGDINFGSPMQLLPALQRVVSKKLKGTGKDELRPYKTHPVVVLLNEWKGMSKHLSGFVEKIRDFIQPDGKLHGGFKPNGARTGRYSSVEPNLQQQPPEARKMYHVDPLSLILGLDFSAQEPRMLTHYTQETILIENYTNGRDLYATLASEFYGKPYEECYKKPNGDDTKERKEFKVVVLAIMYGMGAGSLGASLGIPTRQAQEMLDKFDIRFPKIAEFVKNNTKEACKNGYVTMELVYKGILLQRKRRLPFFKGENPNRVYDTYSTNAKIQGTSAMQTKLCMIEGYKLCKQLSTKERSFALLATVHDELLFRVPMDITDAEIQLFRNLMIQTVKLNNIPSGTDAELGNCWGKMVKKVA